MLLKHLNAFIDKYTPDYVVKFDDGSEVYKDDDKPKKFPDATEIIVYRFFTITKGSKFKKIKNIRTECNGKVKLVGDMSFMFHCTWFIGDVSDWDVSEVTNMSYMFYNTQVRGNCTSWDVSNVTNMSGLFYYTSFNGEISNWDVSNVTNMAYMFCKALFNRDLSNWDVSNVIDMKHMFTNTPLEKNGNLPHWYKN